MLHWHSVWKHMRELTNKEVEKRAVMELINHLENQTDLIIKQSLIELHKLNELKEIQGQYSKMRIDKNCINNAIKTLNGNCFSPLPNRTGGIKKGKKIDKKHLPKNDMNVEVA